MIEKEKKIFRKMFIVADLVSLTVSYYSSVWISKLNKFPNITAIHSLVITFDHDFNSQG